MPPKITAHRAPGTRDFLPDEMALRRKVRRVIEEAFERYGFQPLETPAVERLDVLTGKYGEEADRLIFRILKRGDELEAGKASGELADLALRYDLTVPLARVVAMHRGELTYPFKRYQIQPVWRAERPQKGRYREFVQCDADIVGTASVTADAEIIALTHDILQRLGIPGFRIFINHRKLLQAVAQAAYVGDDRFLEMCLIIDKADKIGLAGVWQELEAKGFSGRQIDLLKGMLSAREEPSAALKHIAPYIDETDPGRVALEEMTRLFSDLEALGVPAERIALRLYLARGLDYYTGPIFETLVEEPRIGSVTGGGRYDTLIGMFSGESIPATGTTIGIERLFDVMRELQLFGESAEASARVLVTVFSEESRGASLQIATELRRAGISAEVYLEAPKKLGKQFAYADKKRIPFVVVAGPDEIARGEVTLKTLATGSQAAVPRDRLIDEVRLLGGR
ncbi:MAG: histidine--tRNA ligase [Candidatus Zixiibacteriota bacterium]|nr:MAG: histidine--tRNA ligase [candidate division Zixibacteria bacterium]